VTSTQPPDNPFVRAGASPHDLWGEIPTADVAEADRDGELPSVGNPTPVAPLGRCGQVLVATYALARNLAQSRSPHDLHQLITEAIAHEVGADVAALAIYQEDEQRLAVVATHGYPAVLVEDLRITPGSGVLGGVFASRQPLLVIDASRERAAQPPRLRYRTGSFLAAPLYAGRDGLGVIALTDRHDGLPFTRADLTTVRALAAPAALALARERLDVRVQELGHAAAVDPLTSLYNRRYFETRITEEIQRARRYGLDLALLMVDADDFKGLNDRLGHLVGDRVLKTMAELLRRSVRAFDVCARFGGEEFAIVLPGSDEKSAMLSAERIRHRIESYQFEEELAAQAVHPTISIGVAILSADGGAQDLIGRADRALYRAKTEGKNRVKLAPTS
jgi:diguanylate cyclase (GGDEF)-like protein